MRLRRHGDDFVIEMSRDEFVGLRTCLLEAVGSLSRSEFYIRTGWAKKDVSEMIEKFDSFSRSGESQTVVEIPEAVESEENPPRPRPGTGPAA